MNISWRTNSIHVLSTIVLCVGSSSSSLLWNESKTGNCNTTFNRTTMMMTMRYIECISLSTWNWQDIVVDETERTKLCALYVCQITSKWNGREEQQRLVVATAEVEAAQENNSITQQHDTASNWMLLLCFVFMCGALFFSLSPPCISVLFAARKARDNLTVIWTHCTYLHLEGSANRHSGKLHTICGRSVLTKKKTTTIKKI